MRLYASALLLALAACPQRPAPVPSPPLPPSTVDDPSDPLRDPREIRLSHVRQLSTSGRAAGPVFSADGKRLAFFDLSLPGAAVETVDLPAGKAVPVPADLPPGERWARIWFGPTGLCGTAVQLDCPDASPCRPAETRPVGAGVCRAPSPLRVPAPAGARELTPSPDGAWLAWIQGGEESSRLFVAPISGATPAAVSPEETRAAQPAWLPGDQRLLFASTMDDAAGRDWDLFEADRDGAGIERLTFTPGADLAPALSPDGRSIAWVSERNAAAPGERDVFLAELAPDPRE